LYNRYNIPLMNKSFKIMGLFLPSKWGTKMNMVKAVVYGSEKTPTEIFAEEAMNPMVSLRSRSAPNPMRSIR
jgi:hypothetical protein